MSTLLGIYMHFQSALSAIKEIEGIGPAFTKAQYQKGMEINWTKVQK